MSADDLTMPDDVAKRAAAELREIAAGLTYDVTRVPRARLAAIADAIDPPPLSLVEQVAQALLDVPHGWPVDPEADRVLAQTYADAVLSVVADALAAQPLYTDSSRSGYGDRKPQRDADVAFIRPGGAT